MSHIGNIAYQQSVSVITTILVLNHQLWGPAQCGVERVMVKSKFHSFVSSKLVGVPNTNEICGHVSTGEKRFEDKS